MPLPAIVWGVAKIGASLWGASKAAKATAKANKASNEVARANLDFQMSRYQDWKDIYGSQQEDIGEYYKNLTGETLVGKELEQVQLASQVSQDKITETLAQRGISGSGLEAQLLTNNITQTELVKADKRASADQRAIDAKTGFLSLGLGQEANIASELRLGSNALSQGLVAQGQDRASSAGIKYGLIENAIDSIGSAKTTNNASLDLF